MTKKLTALAISALLTTALCGCSSNKTDIVTEKSPESTAQQSSVSSVSTVSETSAAESVVSAESSNESSADAPVQESSTVNSTVSSEPTSESSVESEIIYVEPEDEESSQSPEEASMFASRTYLNNGQIPVDVADSKISADAAKDEGKAFYINSYNDFTDFYEKNKVSYSLDDVESGEPFSSAAKEFDETFFETECLIATLQKFEKGTNIEVGDVYKDNNGSVITICKELPSSQANTSYILLLVTIEKSDLDNTKPVIEIISSENYIVNN